ncbi:MAG: hypothetical protein RL113_1484, partial [Pseudomonadota bacterium]
MEKLMKPAEFAKEFGISRQAVYAKIKRKILSTKNVEGKLYIVMDKEATSGAQQNEKIILTKPKNPSFNEPNKSITEYEDLLKAKDETISVLKETVNDLKESNKQISTTLRGEIDLLKEAFYEMRTLYKTQLEHKKMHHDMIDVIEHNETQEWVGVKKFLKHYNITKEKEKAKLIKQLTKIYHNGDERLMQVKDKLKLNIRKNFK